MQISTNKALVGFKLKFLHWFFGLMKVFTNQKQFNQNPILCSKVLNRLGLHVFRVLTAYFSTKIRRFLLSFKISKE